jgi:hypothetical protein
MSRDAHPQPVEESRFQQIQGGRERAEGAIRTAADQQHLAHVGFALESRQVVGEVGAIAHAPGGHVGDRLVSRLP